MIAVDEVGYVPLADVGAESLFRIIVDRTERAFQHHAQVEGMCLVKSIDSAPGSTLRFANGRQLGALVGLVPVPYRSDQRVADQGISKAGRGEIRRVCLQLAWGWLRRQPTSDLTRWFQRGSGAPAAVVAASVLSRSRAMTRATTITATMFEGRNQDVS